MNFQRNWCTQIFRCTKWTWRFDALFKFFKRRPSSPHSCYPCACLEDKSETTCLHFKPLTVSDLTKHFHQDGTKSKREELVLIGKNISDVQLKLNQCSKAGWFLYFKFIFQTESLKSMRISTLLVVKMWESQVIFFPSKIIRAICAVGAICEISAICVISVPN